MCMCMCVRTYVCVCMYVYAYVCVYVCMCVCMCQFFNHILKFWGGYIGNDVNIDGPKFCGIATLDKGGEGTFNETGISFSHKKDVCVCSALVWCLFAFVRVCMCVCMYVYVYARVYVCVCVCPRVYVCTTVRTLYIYICMIFNHSIRRYRGKLYHNFDE